MILKLSCPICKRIQNYEPKAGAISEKIKRCVYCGHSFRVHSDQQKSRIIKVIKH